MVFYTTIDKSFFVAYYALATTSPFFVLNPKGIFGKVFDLLTQL